MVEKIEITKIFFLITGIVLILIAFSYAFAVFLSKLFNNGHDMIALTFIGFLFLFISKLLDEVNKGWMKNQ